MIALDKIKLGDLQRVLPVFTEYTAVRQALEEARRQLAAAKAAREAAGKVLDKAG